MRLSTWLSTRYGGVQPEQYADSSPSCQLGMRTPWLHFRNDIKVRPPYYKDRVAGFVKFVKELYGIPAAVLNDNVAVVAENLPVVHGVLSALPATFYVREVRSLKHASV